MTLLALSLVALLVGPVLSHVARRHPSALAGLDGFVVITIAGIVATHVVPHALVELGLWTLLPLTLGLLLPTWLDRISKRSSPLERISERSSPLERASPGARLEILLVVGLAAHAFLDGTALNTHEGHHHETHAHAGGQLLALAVALHRVPEGLAIWWLVSPRRGAKWASIALAFVAGASCAGFLLSESLVEHIPETALVVIEALVAGSLLHVVVHHEMSRAGPEEEHDHGHAHVHSGGSLANGCGALIGAAFLMFVTREHPITHRVARELGFGATMRTLALSSATPLLIALGMSSLLHATGRRNRFAATATLSRARAALRGVAQGIFLPICSCGVLAFYKRRTVARSPDAGSLALLVSAPEMELASALLSTLLIGPLFAFVRLASMALLGFICGSALGNDREHDLSKRSLDSPLEPTRCDLKRGLRFALGETVEHTGPWILFGLFLAALVEPFLDSAWIRVVPVVLIVPALALVGALVPMCASGVTPLLAVLLHKGLSPGAALAFVMTAAAANVRVLRLLARLHGASWTMRYATTVTVLAIAFGYGGILLWPRGIETSLHLDAADLPTNLQWVCLATLGFTLVLAVLRRGPRPLLRELLFGRRLGD